MEGIWKHKYDLFLQELSAVTSNGLLNEPFIEQCLWVCNRTLHEIKAEPSKLLNQPSFVKNVYPHFLAEAEYFKYIAYVHLFCPTENIAERRLFLEREKHRLEKFEQQHSSFLDYYNSGSSQRDEFYFGKAAWHWVTILSGWLALKKYNLYIDLIT